MASAELAPRGVGLLADLVLVLHVAVVVFVVGGLALIWIGNRVGLRFANRLGFRVAHLLAIAIVVAESWLGIVCPLTTLEQALRAQAGGATLAAGQGFIAGWLSHLLYYDAPDWVFTVAYSVFGLLVVATWWRFPPQRRRTGATSDDESRGDARPNA